MVQWLATVQSSVKFNMESYPDLQDVITSGVSKIGKVLRIGGRLSAAYLLCRYFKDNSVFVWLMYLHIKDDICLGDFFMSSQNIRTKAAIMSGDAEVIRDQIAEYKKWISEQDPDQSRTRASMLDVCGYRDLHGEVVLGSPEVLAQVLFCALFF